MFDKCLNASAKVACDYATELSFLNRIFNRTPKSLKTSESMGEKIFSKKKCDWPYRLNRTHKSHSLVFSSIYQRLFLSIRHMVVPGIVCRYIY